jgi:hypothetical protein
LGQRKRLREKIVSYFNNNGIIALKKCVCRSLTNCQKNLKKEMINILKTPLEILIAKKRIAININVIFNFFGVIDLYKKNYVNPKKNCENFEFINFQKSLAHSVC